MLRIRYKACFLVGVTLLICAACHPKRSSPAVDRHDPEAVLRAYFAAWARNDTEAQISFMAAGYGRLADEPVDSLRILSLAPADGGSSTRKVYSVSFDITFTGGRSVSMENGRYYWTYTLTWDAARESWLITNYGAG
jgi:hypothetical protein